jgi:Transposase DDE domain
VDVSTFIVTVFCLIDDWLKERPPLRRRGPSPKLSDAETLTIEVVGEFLGIDTAKGLHRFFSRHYPHFFPSVGKLHRTTFSRQAANLWATKEALWRHLASDGSEEPFVVDSFPVPACRGGRSHRCKLLWEAATYGYDETNRTSFYGMRAYLLVRWPGVVCGLSLAPANVHDLVPVAGLLEGAGAKGLVLGDRNYWSPELAERLLGRGAELLSPFKNHKGERHRWPRWLVHKRRRIETVIAQLVGRYNAKKVWTRDTWHLRSRFLRKVLSHTIAVLLCERSGLSPLRFSELLTD